MDNRKIMKYRKFTKFSFDILAVIMLISDQLYSTISKLKWISKLVGIKNKIVCNKRGNKVVFWTIYATIYGRMIRIA